MTKKLVTVLLTVVLTAGLTAGVAVSAATPASAAASKFTPRAGVTFNSPLGSRAVRRAIFNKIIRSINSVPRGGDIKIFTWNFLTREGTDALLRAQRRNVRVRLLMDDINTIQIDNQPFQRLKRGLRAGNKGRPKTRKSWAKLCVGSCRGKTGSAHSKFFLFSKVGKARNVVIQGSANLTLAATNNQWNDAFTYVNQKSAYNFMSRIWHEAAADRPLRSPLAKKKLGGGNQLVMFPLTKGKPDPVMRLLKKVRCWGAKNTASHRTVIRIAPDVIRQNRGMRMAKRVRYLWNHGCDIRVGYTVVGIDIGRYLRSSGGRGPVPMKHLVQDFNGDGQFDNYFHLKSMTIRGHFGGNRKAWVTLNGSANWSGLAGVSDENLGIYYRRNVTAKYERHLSYWYTNFPKKGSASSASATARAAAPDSSELIFGAGKNAVYEDGQPVPAKVGESLARLTREQ